MFLRETNKDTMASLTVSFRNLLAILKSTVEDINGAPKDTTTLQEGTFGLDP